MNKVIWVILATIIIAGGGIALYTRQNSANKIQDTNDIMTARDDNAMQKEKDEVMGEKKDSDIMENKETIIKDESTMQKQDGDEMMQKPGAYKDYSPTALAEASKNGKTVLFFWASWCPFCKTANEAFLSRASDIPSGVTVLKTNYDTEKELKTKYGVTYQHTFVQVDSDGKMLAKWNGGDIDSLRENIK